MFALLELVQDTCSLFQSCIFYRQYLFVESPWDESIWQVEGSLLQQDEERETQNEKAT